MQRSAVVVVGPDLAIAQAGASKRRVGRSTHPAHDCSVQQPADPVIVEQAKETAQAVAGNENKSQRAILADVLKVVRSLWLLHDFVTKIPPQMHRQNGFFARRKGQLAGTVVRASRLAVEKREVSLRSRGKF